MKVSLSLNVLEGYSTIVEKKVEVDVDEIKCPSDVREALEAIHTLAINKELLEFSDGVALDLFLRMREKQITDKATEEAKAINNKPPDHWKLTGEIADLKQALKRKECQLDGVIKGLNPDYIPTPDADGPQTLK